MHSVYTKEPTDPKQLLHLIDMNAFFQAHLDVNDIEEAAIMNYHYGIEYTKDFNEFCDTMHTALYWLDQNYGDAFIAQKTGEIINLCSKIDDIDDDIYRMDVIFGAWLSFVLCDSQVMREQFLAELDGLTEDQFIDELVKVSDNLELVETFTINWIKKMIDHSRAASYGYYMLYLMLKVAHKLKCNKHSIISKEINKLYIFTQAASRLYLMEQHNLPLN